MSSSSLAPVSSSSLKIRAQIKIVQLFISNKRMVKRIARYFGGETGLEIYNKVVRLIDALMNNDSSKGNKMFKHILKLIGELGVLHLSGVISMSDWDSFSVVMSSILKDHEKFMQTNHKALGLRRDVWTILDPDEEQTICKSSPTYLTAYTLLKSQTAATIANLSKGLIETVGHHLQPKSIAKLHKMKAELSSEHVLDQICDYDSKSWSIIKEIPQTIGIMLDIDGGLGEIVGI